VVAKPTLALHAAFTERMQAESKSIVLFHGTKLHNLHNILTNGFEPSSTTRYGEGVFMAEEPGHTYEYAAGKACASPEVRVPTWKNGPFEKYTAPRALLGYEVVGNGRHIGKFRISGCHVVEDLKSVTVRYVKRRG
jgi:hypothetical protein